MNKPTDNHKSKDFLGILKIFKNITTILFILSVIVFAAYALSPLLSSVFGSYRSIEATSLGFTLKIGSGLIEKFPHSYFIILYLSSCAALMIIAVIFAIIQSILKDILKSGTPFTKSLPKKIRLIAFIILVYLLVNWLGQFAAYFVLTNDELLNLKISGIKFASSFNFDYTPIFVSGLIYLLSYIFDYGLYLKEDNESII